MIRHQKRSSFLALVLSMSLVAAACGDDDEVTNPAEESSAPEAEGTEGGDSEGVTEEDSEAAEGEEGGEIIDLGTFVGDPPEHIDPALNSTVDAYQVINLMYDGLTEIDYSDLENPELKGVVAETFEPNDDATEWTFTLRDDVVFSDGEEVLPSSFQRAWERATDPDFAGDYSYLFNFIEGGEEKLAGDAEEISGIEVDDEARTLTVTLSAPYANFSTVAGFQTFYPMHSEIDDLTDQSDYENGIMIGNGPYSLAEPRTEQEIILERNEEWSGDFRNDRGKADRIIFLTSQDPDSSYNSFEAGEGDTANIPPARVQEAEENYANTLDAGILGSYHFDLNLENPLVGGPENVDLRRAISLAIDREQINEAVYNGSRTLPTGLVMDGIPGYEEGICEYCVFDEEAAQAAFDEWTAAGNTQSEPIPIQFNSDAGHEPVIQIVIDNLETVGIEAVADPRDSETYFSELADGACVFCRAGWFADYPTYDNYLYDLFHSDAADGGNNYSQHKVPEYDALVDEAKAETDLDAAGELYREAETFLLNESVAVVPINVYRGDYVYNDEKLANFVQTPLGLVLFDQITVTE